MYISPINSFNTISLTPNIGLQQTVQPTFTGGAEIPDSYMRQILERSAVVSLAKYGVVCPCCGNKMIDPRKLNNYLTKGTFQQSTPIVIKILDKYTPCMKKNEKMVFSTIKELHKKYPNHTLPDLLNEIKKNSEFVLIEKQSKIFGKLYDYTKKHLSNEKLEELNGLIQKSYEEMYNPSSHSVFGRKKFIGLITRFAGDISEKDRDKLVEIAEQLPSSKDDIAAFVVKYSRSSNEEIAERLLRPSTATIEHVKPRANNGEDSIYNYAAECAADNWEKGDTPVYEQVKKHPSMARNVQIHINQIIKLIKSKKVPKLITPEYVEKISDTFEKESGNSIKIDRSSLY